MPTTYAGAEWTPYYGMLLAPGRKGGGGDERAKPVAAIYDPELTLDLPRAATRSGTAMNALAHCAEAYYAAGHTERGDRHADTGATAIDYALPLVAERPDWHLRAHAAARRSVPRGAGTRGSRARARPCHGTGARRPLRPAARRDERALPARALRFNEPAVPEAIARFGRALHTDDPAARVEELARLGGFERLRDFGVPEAELGEVAEEVVRRPGAKANPRPATPAEVEELLRSIW